MLYSHLHPELEFVILADLTSEKWDWNMDRQTILRAQGLLALLQKSEFIMAFVAVKDFLSVLIKRNDCQTDDEKY